MLLYSLKLNLCTIKYALTLVIPFMNEINYKNSNYLLYNENSCLKILVAYIKYFLYICKTNNILWQKEKKNNQVVKKIQLNVKIVRLAMTQIIQI